MQNVDFSQVFLKTKMTYRIIVLALQYNGAIGYDMKHDKRQ